MLALNAGMIEADIGRLTLDEINVRDKYVFWDREKQPDNNLRVRHNLWPETLSLVRQFIQPPNTKQRFFTDYRKKVPTEVDCSRLAFVSAKGDPLYRVRPNGKATDLIYKRFAEIEAKDNRLKGFWFQNLRKSTNKALKDLLRSKAEHEKRGLTIAITEISDTFLAHKNPELQMTYDTLGITGFGLMNKYLTETAALMRKNGVFNSIK